MNAKILTLLLTSASLCFSLTLQADDNNGVAKHNNGSVTKEITSASVYVMPYEGFSNADGTGYYFDILRAIYEPAGITLNFHRVPYKRAIEAIATKKGDITISAAEDFNEHNVGYYSQKPVEVTYVSYIHKNSTPYQNASSFTGKTLGWIRGYDFESYLDISESLYTPKTFTNNIQGLKMLKANRIDYFVDYEDTVISTAKKNNFDLSDYTFTTAWPEYGYVGATLNERGLQLIQIHDDGIKRIYESGEFEAIVKKYQDQGIILEKAAQELLSIHASYQ